MKRPVSLLAGLLLIMALGMAARASDLPVYPIREAGVKVSIPERYAVSPGTELPKSQEERDALARMREENICLKAVDEEAGTELVFVVRDSAFSDLEGFSDDALRTFASLLERTGGGERAEVEDCAIWTPPFHEQRYLKFRFRGREETGEGPLYGLCCHTVHLGKALSAAMYSRRGALSPAQEAELAQIVEGMQFGGNLVPLREEHTEPLRFSDPAAGVSFTVPEDWERADTQGGGEDGWTLEVRSLTDPGLKLCYGGADSREPQASSSRPELQQSAGTPEEAASLMGVSSEQVSQRQWGGRTYLCVRSEQTSSDLGLEVLVPVITCLREENGWRYCFQLSGAGAAAESGELEALMETVEYSVPSVPSAPETLPKAAASGERGESVPEPADPVSGGEGWTGFRPTALLLDLLIAVLLYTLPVFVYRWGIRRAPVERKRALCITIVYGLMALLLASGILVLLHGSWMVDAVLLLWSGVHYRMLTGGARRPRYCRYCGRKLAGGEAVCSGCGKRL